MTFAPKIWHDGHQNRTIFIVREMVKNTEILVLDSMGRYKVQTVSKAELTEVKDVDFGGRQERMMKSTLRRIGKKKGTTKKAREAIVKVLS